MRVLISLFLVAAAVFINMFPWPAAVADRIYSMHMLPALNEAALSWSAFAVPPFLVIVLALALTLLTRQRWRILGPAALFAAFVFPFTFGLGYRTTPLEQRLEAAHAAPEATALAAHTAAALLHLPGESATAWETQVARASTCVSEFLNTTEVFPNWQAPAPRTVPAGWLLTFGVSGFINPFTHEVHIDRALPAWYTEHVLRHEFAHTAGFSREAEAEAVALLAGLTCANESAQYTGYVALVVWLQNAGLIATGALPSGVQLDIAALQSSVATHTNTALEQATSAVYSQYLQTQGTAGTTDYARALTITAQVFAAHACWFSPDCVRSVELPRGRGL